VFKYTIQSIHASAKVQLCKLTPTLTYKKDITQHYKYTFYPILWNMKANSYLVGSHQILYNFAQYDLDE